MDDVRTYFKGKSWPSTEVNGDQFHGVSIWNFRVDFVQNDPEYKIEIISPEDPEDSDSFTTRDPISDIKKFLSKGMSDTEWLKAASDVNYFSDILRRLANSIEKSHHPSIRKVSRLLRRISLIDVGSRIARSMSDDLESLYQQMEKEGWKVKEKIDGESHFLHVDVGDGLYEITIVPSSIQWKYNIEFIGNDDLTTIGRKTRSLPKPTEPSRIQKGRCPTWIPKVIRSTTSPVLLSYDSITFRICSLLENRR
jgi:hypothetical protein